MSPFNPELDVESFVKDVTINVLTQLAPAGGYGLFVGPIIGLFWTEAKPKIRTLTIGEVRDIATNTAIKIATDIVYSALENVNYTAMVDKVRGCKGTFYKQDYNDTTRAEAYMYLQNEMYQTWDEGLFKRLGVSPELTIVPFTTFAHLHLTLLYWGIMNLSDEYKKSYRAWLLFERDLYRKYAVELIEKIKKLKEATVSEVFRHEPEPDVYISGYLAPGESLRDQDHNKEYFYYYDGQHEDRFDLQSEAIAERIKYIARKCALIDKQAEPYIQWLNPLHHPTDGVDCVDFVAYGQHRNMKYNDGVPNNDTPRIAGILRRIKDTYTWIETNEIGGLLHPDAAIASTSGDLIGDYECHLYDQKGKNDWHYVTISKVNETTLTWTNRAGVSWTLTLTPDKTTLWVGPGGSNGGRHPHATVVWAGDQVSGLRGPSDELYEKSSHSGPTSSSPSSTSGGLIGVYDEVRRDDSGVWLIPYRSEYNKPDYDPGYALHIESITSTEMRVVSRGQSTVPIPQGCGAVSFHPSDHAVRLDYQIRDVRPILLAYSSGDTGKGIFPSHGSGWMPGLLYKKPADISGDLIGDYECHQYDQKGKNDWHYVTISKVNETTLTWTNRAGVSWPLTATPNKSTLNVDPMDPHSTNPVTVVWAGDQVSGLLGNGGGFYDKTGDYSHLGVKLKNVITNRYLFSAGDAVTSSKGSSAPVLGADANYYHRADWLLKRVRDGYTLKNRVTMRYLRSEGKPVQGAEGGWLNSPPVVGPGGEFDGGEVWELIKSGDSYLLRNRSTGRYLFMTGEPVKESEGGWLNSPVVVGTDLDYYNRAIWGIDGPGAEQITQPE